MILSSPTDNETVLSSFSIAWKSRFLETECSTNNESSVRPFLSEFLTFVSVKITGEEAFRVIFPAI